MGNSDQLAVELATSITNLKDATSSLSSIATSFITTSSSLTSASSAFASVVEKIETRFGELARWEESLKEQKRQLDELNKALEEREIKLIEALEKREAKIHEDTQALSRKLMEVQRKEEDWEETKRRIQSNLDAAADLVTVNVGGEMHVLAKQSLTAHVGSLFHSDLSSDLYRNKSTIVYAQASPYFHVLADYLRYGKITKKIKDKHLSEVHKIFNDYKVPFPELPLPERGSEPSEKTLFEGGNLLTTDWQKVVRSWLPACHLVLLYKGSKDGFAPEAYHDKCDARGPLLTVIMSSEGFLFGGYVITSIADGSDSSTLLSNSFLFTLTNPHALPPVTFPLLPGIWPTRYTPTEHLHLGWGRIWYDLALSKAPQSDKKSYVAFPGAFRDTQGHGKLTFTGTEYFTVRDIEVFSVVPSASDFYSNVL